MTLAIAALAIASALSFAMLARVAPTADSQACEAIPRNVTELGPALSPNDAAKAMGAYGQDWAALKAAVRPGDTVHVFETGVTGGHLVMRGDCYIGEAVAWIR